jgi:hypothetical protein
MTYLKICHQNLRMAPLSFRPKFFEVPSKVTSYSTKSSRMSTASLLPRDFLHFLNFHPNIPEILRFLTSLILEIFEPPAQIMVKKPKYFGNIKKWKMKWRKKPHKGGAKYPKRHPKRSQPPPTKKYRLFPNFCQDQFLESHLMIDPIN